jgi:hypothetical protein
MGFLDDCVDFAGSCFATAVCIVASPVIVTVATISYLTDDGASSSSGGPSAEAQARAEKAGKEAARKEDLSAVKDFRNRQMHGVVERHGLQVDLVSIIECPMGSRKYRELIAKGIDRQVEEMAAGDSERAEQARLIRLHRALGALQASVTLADEQKPSVPARRAVACRNASFGGDHT